MHVSAIDLSYSFFLALGKHQTQQNRTADRDSVWLYQIARIALTEYTNECRRSGVRTITEVELCLAAVGVDA